MMLLSGFVGNGILARETIQPSSVGVMSAVRTPVLP